MSADVALRLAACFETTPAFWLNLQLTYDLRPTTCVKRKQNVGQP